MELEIAELEKMLPGPISPIRRGSLQNRSSVDRDVAELERMLSPMRRKSLQFADSFPVKDLDSMIAPTSPIRRGSRAFHTLDAESIVDGTLASMPINATVLSTKQY